MTSRRATTRGRLRDRRQAGQDVGLVVAEAVALRPGRLERARRPQASPAPRAHRHLVGHPGLDSQRVAWEKEGLMLSWLRNQIALLREGLWPDRVKAWEKKSQAEKHAWIRRMNP